MSAATLLASTVMDASAALMNDPLRTIYNYTAQTPFLRLALQELQEFYELHSIPVTEKQSAFITMLAGQFEIIYDGGAGVPTLPSDMIEPITVWEAQSGSNSYIPMTRKNFLPPYMADVAINNFIFYSWNGQKITVPVANAPIDIKIDYNRELFPDIPLVSSNTILNIVNAATFLEYRTAGLLAEFIERNLTSANALSAYAQLGIERATGIDIKGKQNIQSRRRPFRSGFKSRGQG